MRFSIIIKPTHNCVLSCKYCYVEDDKTKIMNVQSLTNVIKKIFEYPPLHEISSVIDFIWHGGEPLMAGMNFYENAVMLQKKYGNNIKYTNSVQTNGILLDDKWADFFKNNGFRISMSIDGPKQLNDKSRVFKNGDGTFTHIMKAINVVKEANIPLGVCVVISKQNKDFADEIYDFLSEEKLNFNIIPLNRCGSAAKHFEDIGLESHEYALPWTNMYDRWFYASGDDYVYCSDFAFKTAAILTGAPTDCVGFGRCSSENISVDPEGFAYPCATMSSDSRWRYGNVNDSTIQELMESSTAKIALSRRSNPCCVRCKWQHVCNGGCLARSIKFFDDIHARDYYCPSLRKIYEHIENRLIGDGMVPGHAKKCVALYETNTQQKPYC